MPNPMTPNIQTALPNLGFGGMSSRPEPSFFGQGGGFQSFGSNLRQITRPLAAGFAKDPNYRAIAAQQIATEQQMQQEQAAQLRKMVIEASLDNLGTLAESVRGVGSQTLMENPNSLKYLQRALESTKQSLVANGWDPNDAEMLTEQYGQKFFIYADMPGEQNELEQKIGTLEQQLGRKLSEDELTKLGGAYIEPQKSEGRKLTVALGEGQTQEVTVYDDGTTDLIVGGRPVMAGEIMGGSGDYRTQLAQDESSGGKVTKNPLNPNVSGKYQIDFEKSWPQLKGLDDEAALTVVQNTNAQEFKAAFGKDPTDADQYGMHRLGAGGYKELLSAPVGANVVDVVGEVVVEDNPDLAGKTVGDVIGEWKSRYGGGTTWRNTQGQGDVISQLKRSEKKEAIQTKQIYDPNSPTGIRIVTEEEAIGQPGVPPAQAAAMENKSDKEWEDRQTAVKVFEAQAERIKKKLAKGTAVGGVSSLVQTIAGIGAQAEMLGETFGVDASIADPEQYIGEIPQDAADMGAALQSDIVGLAYAMALAQNGNRVTNEDVKRALQQIGDSGMLSDPSQIVAALDSSLDAMYTGLEAEAEARQRKLTIKRKGAIGDENIPDVKSDEDYMGLPKGTRFRDPEGNIRVKP